PVAALEVERDLRVAGGILALADVAGGRLHRDHIPGEQESEGDVDRQPPVAEGGGEEARAVDLVEVEDLTRVRLRRVEDQSSREEGHRDQREESERRREARA